MNVINFFLLGALSSLQLAPNLNKFYSGVGPFFSILELFSEDLFRRFLNDRKKEFTLDWKRPQNRYATLSNCKDDKSDSLVQDLSFNDFYWILLYESWLKSPQLYSNRYVKQSDKGYGWTVQIKWDYWQNYEMSIKVNPLFQK